MSGCWFQWHEDQLLLSLRVQPRAARDEIIGPVGDNLKVRITAPPVDGKANTHLLKFLAKSFGVPRKRVLLLGGETGRDKRVAIADPARLPVEAQVDPPPTRD